ncbi:type I restriction endonuclease subunit S [Brochothrix thermosphacta]|nr:restriction endonuclease subunit S [Brochothrix thermosphacta]ODJ74575.1 type I restriction endonuclease subunit S [Brochothrix thermosphacta]
MEHKNIPEIRFSGFTNEWEQRKLGDYIIQYSEKTKQNNQYPVFTSSRNGLFFQKDYYKGNQIASEDNIGYNIVPRGYFTYRHMSDDLVFKFNINDLADYGIVSTLYPVFTTNEQLDSKYLQYQLNEGTEFRCFSLLQKQGGSRTYMYLNKLQNMILKIPKLEEQQKIGSFFKQLDDNITLHQRKLDLLKEQKKGFLQKMFPKNGETVPELRFSGFTNEWEQCKLSDITKRVIRKNKNLESTLPLTISAQEGLIDQNEFFNKTIASRDVSGYYLIKNGEFAYNKSYSNGYPWGAVKRLNRYNMGVLSTLYIVFKPTNIDSDFLEKYYDTTYWHKEISKHAAEGARNHGLLNIAATDFFKTELVISKSLEEQQKIGSFFKQLDETIALHQRKLELLKEQKKGFLQKMFPKNS